MGDKEYKKCRYCPTIVSESEAKSAIGGLIGCGFLYVDAVAELPICRQCLESRHIEPSRKKFHPHPDINSACLWAQSRSISGDSVSIEENPHSFTIRIGRRSQRIPKNAEPIPRGVLFRRLDSLISA